MSPSLNVPLSRPMASWVPSFAEKILTSTHEKFYNGAALVLREIIGPRNALP
jgi:TorA maturation chaperone TorD